MSFAADTSVWIDYLRGIDSRQALILDASLITKRIIVPDLVVLEVLRGVASSKSAAWVEDILETLQIVPIGGRDMVGRAASNFRLLRAKGITIRGSIDLLIGTWCIENNVPLLHNDRDFDKMQRHLGLMCVPVTEFQ